MQCIDYTERRNNKDILAGVGIRARDLRDEAMKITTAPQQVFRNNMRINTNYTEIHFKTLIYP